MKLYFSRYLTQLYLYQFFILKVSIFTYSSYIIGVKRTLFPYNCNYRNFFYFCTRTFTIFLGLMLSRFSIVKIILFRSLFNSKICLIISFWEFIRKFPTINRIPMNPSFQYKPQILLNI